MNRAPSTIYIFKDGVQTGPFTVTQIRDQLAKGVINASVLASYEPGKTGRPLIKILADLQEPKPTPSRSGKKRVSGGWIAWGIVGLYIGSVIVIAVKTGSWQQVRPFVFWPVALVAVLLLFRLSERLILIPVNILLALTRNIMLRGAIALLFQITRWVVLAVIVVFLIAARSELRLWHLLVLTIVAGWCARGLDHVTLSLNILADNLFWEQKSDDRLAFVRAVREKAGRKSPIWLERVLASEAHRREQMKQILQNERTHE